MNYKEISKETIGYLYKTHTSIRKSGLDEKLIALVELRVSQMNGCAYCCAFHSNELRLFNVSQIAIDKLPGWRVSADFDEKQKIALKWAEILTNKENNSLLLMKDLEKHFNEKEIVELTTCVLLMNTLNMLRISLGDDD